MSEIRINKVQINVPPTTPKLGEKKTAEEQTTKSKPELNQKSAEDILDYMAKSAIPAGVVGKKPVDVKKYVDQESQQRIEQIMQTFEETILKSAEVAINEFGLSEEAATDVAIVGFNQKFLV